MFFRCSSAHLKNNQDDNIHSYAPVTALRRGFFILIMPIENIFSLNDYENGGTKTYELRNQEIEGGVTLVDVFTEKHIYLNLEETKKLIIFLSECIDSHVNLFK